MKPCVCITELIRPYKVHVHVHVYKLAYSDLHVHVGEKVWFVVDDMYRYMYVRVCRKTADSCFGLLGSHQCHVCLAALHVHVRIATTCITHCANECQLA